MSSKHKNHRWPNQDRMIGSPKPECLDCGCVKFGNGKKGSNYMTVDGQYHHFAPTCETPKLIQFSVKRKAGNYPAHIVKVYESQVCEDHITSASTGGVYYFNSYDIQRIDK